MLFFQGLFFDAKCVHETEFQATRLRNKGSDPIVRDEIEIGKKMKYICGKENCSFAIGIATKTDDPIKIELGTASRLGTQQAETFCST